MSSATIIAEAFGEGANLYTDVLGLSSSSSEVTASQLRKAYYKRALKYHPDKQREKTDEDAKIKFQAISVAYTLLSDPEKRKEYDETGELYEDDDADKKTGTEAWTDYFRGIFGTVTTDDIDKFSEQYKCSEEEEKDVLKYYRQFKGNLDKMLECVMCSSDIDKKRWVQDYIQPAIQTNTVPDYTDQLNQTLGDDDDDEDEEMVVVADIHEDDEDATESDEDESDDHCAKQKKKTKKKTPSKKKKTNPKKRVNTKHNHKKNKSNNGNDDLIAAIRNKSVAKRQEAFDSMLMGLEERYAPPKKGSKKKKKQSNYDISDEEFEKIRSKLGNKRK